MSDLWRRLWSAANRTSLGGRDQKLLRFIQDFQRIHQRQPSVLEVQQGCGISSPAVISRYLDYLKHNGYI
jgi:SOS-response transcriptional repressor LexA